MTPTTVKGTCYTQSYVKVAGQKLTILRGNLKVIQEGDVKTATIGLLCSDHVWYDITATTALPQTTANENITITNDPQKYILNGQLIIKRSDTEYNLQGAILKDKH